MGKKFFAVLLSMVLLLGAFRSDAIVAHADGVGEGELVKSVSVSVEDASGNVKDLNASGDTKISLNDKIKVEYRFNDLIVIHPAGSPVDSSMEGYHVVACETYELPGIPAICVAPGGKTIDVTSAAGTLGVLTIDEAGNASIKISDSFDEMTDAQDATAGFELSLNLNKENNGDVENYELNFGDTTYRIIVSDFGPQPPTVEKTSSDMDAEGNITWTVTLKNDAKPVQYSEALSISDTFSEGQSFVPGSFTVTNGESVTPSVNGNTVSWNYLDNTASKVTTFQYKTHVDFVALTKDENKNATISKNVSNNVSVTAPGTDDYDSLSISASADSTVSKTVDKWIDKTSTPVDANGEATWTIVVKNNGFTLQNVVLHDTIAADSGVNIVLSDVSVKDALDNDVLFTEETTSTSHDIKFTGVMTGNAVYTVTYKTTIQNYAKYLKENHNVPKNTAWITYEYDANGTGEYTAVKGPDIGVNFTGTGVMDKAAIKKSAAGINRINHTMDWLVQDNNEQPLTGVTVTDAIPEGHDFVSVSEVMIDGVAATEDQFSVNTEDPRNIKVVFGDNIENKKATFKITTVLADAERAIWAGNATKEYLNSVTLSSDGNDDVTDSAKQTFESKVLAKTAGSYDYNTHIIPYTITLNQNKMPMHNVVITDPLDSRLEYVDGSSNVAETTYDAASNTLTFSFDTITDETVITFNAKVKDGDTFNSNGRITIPNSASVTSLENETQVNVSASTNIDNKVIAKKGNRNDEVIDYVVEVNVAQQDLYRSGVDEVVIQDKIGASLVLSEDSVVLYEAQVNANGTLTKIGEVDTEVRIEYGSDKTTLEVVLPEVGADKAYILEYAVKMLKPSANDFSNNVSLKGYGSEDNNTASVTYNQRDFSSVNFNKYVYYIFDLRDRFDTATVIPGAHFQLIDPAQGDKVVGDAYCDNNGQIIFVGGLVENHNYVLKEIEVTGGYVIPSELAEGKPVTTGSTGYNAALAEKENNRVYNSKPTTTITVDDISKNQGKSLSGAEFELKKDGTTLETWTGDGTVKTIEIPAGEYILERVTAPTGFVDDEESISFTVTDGLAIVINTNTEDITVSGSDIVVKETVDEAAAVPVNTEPTRGSEFRFSDYTGVSIYPAEYSNGSFTGIGENPVWTEGDGTLSLLPQTEYVFVGTDENGERVVKIITVDQNGNVIDARDYVEPPKSTPAPTTPAPSHTSPSQSVGSPQGPGTDVADTTNTDTATNGSGKGVVRNLAKTGGFVGALSGYLAGAVLVLLGVLLLFGKKTEQ